MKKISNPIVFFGNEKLATGIPDAKPIIRNAVVEAGFHIEQIVTGKLSELKPHKAELAVLAAYGHIIPKSVLDRFPKGIINVHPSLLPIYRGPTPIEQAILDGAPKTGVSIMRLTSGMDEGPIYKQKTIHLTGNESKAELAIRLQTLGAELLGEILPSIATGDLKPRSQPHPGRASYSQLLAKQDGVIDWEKPAAQLEREIRAYLGWPGSRTTLFDREVTITKAHMVENSGTDGKPGNVSVVQQDGSITVATSNGSLRLEKLKPSGKKEMTAKEFIAGYYKRS